MGNKRRDWKKEKQQYSSCKPNYINYHSKCKCSKTLNGRYCQNGLKNKTSKTYFLKESQFKYKDKSIKRMK